MSTSSSSSALFSGNSRYAADFQTIIQRSVAIASLPLSQMNSNKTQMTDEQKALESLDTKFSALRTSISALDNVMTSGSIEATLSDTTTVSTTVGYGAVEGTYSIEVTDLGAYTTTLTSDAGPKKVIDPSSQSISNQADPDFTLTVGTKTYTITPASNTLASLVNAINSTTGANVRATMVNVGSASSPDYRLSLQSTKLGDIAVQLNDGAIDLQTEQVRGSVAKYKVNGVATEATSDSRTVTIAPGVNVTMLAKSTVGAATSITLTRESQPISDALSAFVTAYNAAVDELDSQRGSTKGALSGKPVVYDLANALHTIAGYSGSSKGANALADVGVTLDVTGHMTFSPLSFMASNFTDSTGVANFLGSADTSGFLKSAMGSINTVEDPVGGILKTTISAYKTDITNLTNDISEEQSRIDDLQSTLMTQMAAADALIASLEQQYNYMDSVFSSMIQASKNITG